MLRTNKFAFKAKALLLGMATLMLLAGCSSSRDPYSYVQVSGKVTYEDGSLIPANEIVLSFLPEAAAVNPTMSPRAGLGVVDVKTGEFHNVTSHMANDGVVRGKHKVTLTLLNHSPISTKLVPIEYSDYKRTPLEVDTDHLPFEIKVAKPSGSGG